MTQRELMEEGIDMERGEANVAAILGSAQTVSASSAGVVTANSTLAMEKCDECGTLLSYMGRNRLSNCGHMRRSRGKWIPAKEPKPKPQEKAGVLTKEQRQTLAELLNDWLNARQAFVEALQALDNTKKFCDQKGGDYYDYLDSLTAK